MRIASCLLALTASAASLVAQPPAATRPAAAEALDYCALLMDGNKVGYATHARRVAGGQVTTVETMHLSLKRGPLEVTVDTSTTAVETLEGKPLRLSYVQKMGPLATKVDGQIADGKFTYTSSSDLGGQQKQTVPWPDGALLSEGLLLLTRAQGLAPGTRYTARAFSPEALQALDAKVVVGAKEKVDLLGRVVLLTRTDTTLASPMGDITAVSYVNDGGEALKAVSPIAGISLEVISCDRQYALSEDNPPDFMTKFLLTSPRPLSASQKQSPIVYRLAPKGAADLRFPSDGAQWARKLPDGAWEVTVNPRMQAVHEAIPYAGHDATALEALKPSRYVESANPKIVAAARKALAGTTDALQAGRKLEAFVGGYIEKKDLSVGYASAAEVLETRQGDCTEHAVLLAALCRAGGIPAQVVTGMAHVSEWAGQKDVFGPHAWVRAFIAGRWVHLDAALGYDAGHIMLAAGNGDPEGFFSLIGTLGNFTLADVQPTPAPATREH